MSCDEKNQIFSDDVNWTHAFVLDLEVFATSLPLHLNNPPWPSSGALKRAPPRPAARMSRFEISDPNFQQIATVPSVAAPVVHRAGPIDGKTTASMSALMQADQTEVLSLQALDTSMNRATEASYLRGRSDWVAWQLSAAAQFAGQAAAAVDRVIRAQRAVNRALVRRGLLFGVGSTDLKLAQRQVRKHGLAPSVNAVMQGLGMDPSLVAYAVTQFQQANFGQLSFSLTQILSDSATVAGQQALQTALRHFAARIPPATKPPS